MVNDFDRILDECIDRINNGASIKDCLAAYPEYAEKLGPLLHAMGGVQSAGNYNPSADAKRESRQKFYAAIDKRRRPSPAALFLKIFSRPVTWAATAVVLALLIIGISVIQPGFTPPPVQLTSNPDGNFAFFISDEPNDIGDFEHLSVTIEKVSLLSADTPESVVFVPETATVDLTQLKGEASQEIWRGDIPAGKYSEVLVYVSNVEGILVSTGKTISVKLPSNKLHISIPFEIGTGEITSFTFDITVVATGKGGKYILKPHVGESGAK